MNRQFIWIFAGTGCVVELLLLSLQLQRFGGSFSQAALVALVGFLLVILLRHSTTFFTPAVVRACVRACVRANGTPPFALRTRARVAACTTHSLACVATTSACVGSAQC